MHLLQGLAARLLFNAAAVVRACLLEASAVAVSELLGMGLMSCLLEDGFGSFATVCTVIGQPEGKDSESRAAEAHNLARMAAAALEDLMQASAAARQQLAGAWPPMMTRLCRALPPCHLRRVLPHLKSVTAALGTALAADRADAAMEALLLVSGNESFIMPLITAKRNKQTWYITGLDGHVLRQCSCSRSSK